MLKTCSKLLFQLLQNCSQSCWPPLIQAHLNDALHQTSIILTKNRGCALCQVPSPTVHLPWIHQTSQKYTVHIECILCVSTVCTVSYLPEQLSLGSTVADRCHATSRFQFPFSNFRFPFPSTNPSPGTYCRLLVTVLPWSIGSLDLPLVLAPIGHGTYRPRYMPLRVSNFHFPISVFHSLALTLALAPIGHGITVVDRFPRPTPSPGTYRPRYISATVHATSRFQFPFSNFRATDCHFPISIFRPGSIYRLDADLAAFTSWVAGRPCIVCVCVRV